MIAAAIKKDLLLLVRDRGTLITMFLLPVVFIAVFGSIFGGGGGDRRRSLAVWVDPASPRAVAVAAAIDGAGLFRVVPAADAAAARRAVVDDRADAALILGADFDPAGGRPGELAIDQAAPPQVRLPVVGTVTAVVTRAVFPPPAGTDVPVLVPTTPPGIRRELAGVTGFQLTVPGNAVLFGFFLALTVGMAFLEERKWGTWRRVLAAPVARSTILFAKLVPYFLVGLVQFAFLFGIGIVAFGMKVGGSMVALAVLTVAVVLCATCLGLAIAAIGGSEKRMGSIGSVSLLVMGLLGGAMVPRVVMPPVLRAIGLAVPHGWALDGYLALLVRDGAGVVDVLPQIGALVGFSVLFAGFGVARFRFER
ncbi:MAG: ABC transporter permease [Kofleriaceae bacterium]